MRRLILAISCLAAVSVSGAGIEWEKLNSFCEHALIREAGPLPQLVHVVRVPRRTPELRLGTMLGNDRVYGLESITGMLRGDRTAVPEKQKAATPTGFHRFFTDGVPVLAINADFFDIDETNNYTGALRGLMVMNSEIISCPDGYFAYPWQTRADSATVYGKSPAEIEFAVIRPELKAKMPDGRELAISINTARPPDGAVLYTPRMGVSPADRKNRNPGYFMTTRTSDAFELVLTPDPAAADPVVRFGNTATMTVEAVNPAGNSVLAAGKYILALPRADQSLCATVKPGDLINVSFESRPSLTGASFAASGRSILVSGGKIPPMAEDKSRAPRTAIGADADFCYFVVADGRQKGKAEGLTFAELAGLMVRLGADRAVDLDGGGSSMIWVDGKIVNDLYTLPEIRRIGNAIVLINTKPEKKP
ncbi:MAG: phosphodiester glycosidase family protein [Victivallaceae bacterium]